MPAILLFEFKLTQFVLLFISALKGQFCTVHYIDLYRCLINEVILISLIKILFKYLGDLKIRLLVLVN